MWIEDIRGWLNEGVSQEEIGSRLQARVPNFNIYPDPGGHWNWLLGLLAFCTGVAVLLLIARNAVSRAPLGALSHEEIGEEDEQWQDRLDDELLESTV